MLPDTFTLNVGATPADVVYDKSNQQTGSTVYYAPSPNNDLAGRPSIAVSHQATADGLIKSRILVKAPYQVDGEYGQHIQFSGVLTRPDSADLADVDEVLESVQELWAVTDFREDIGLAES